MDGLYEKPSNNSCDLVAIYQFVISIMKYGISCPFSIEISHNISKIGFQGSNQVSLECPFEVKCPMGYSQTQLTVSHTSGNFYLYQIDSDELDTEKKQVQFIEEVSEYLSFHLGRLELNPHYGTHFIKVDWYNFKYNPVGISGSLGVTSSWDLKQQFVEWKYQYVDILNFYFDGLKAEYEKSKYFHWFLILEKLENSNKYKTLFDKQKLFTEADAKSIRELAKVMDNDRKKSNVLDILKATQKTRREKLLEMLAHLGITKYKYLGEEKEITPDIIKSIIDGRNSLFHSSKSFSANTLYFQLFPISTQVIQKLLDDPKFLD